VQLQRQEGANTSQVYCHVTWLEIDYRDASPTLRECEARIEGVDQTYQEVPCEQRP
jgi:hypothetical protein